MPAVVRRMSILHGGCRRPLAVVAITLSLRSAMVLAAEQAPVRASSPFQYDSKNRRDPFTALVRDGRVTSASQRLPAENIKPVLYGILWDSEGQSIALINDRESKVGDTIDGYRVKEIRQDAVVLEGEGGPIELRIAFDASSSASTGAPRAVKGGAKP